MKKIIKTLFIFILSMAIYNAVNAASVTISPTEKTIKPGETVEITVDVKDVTGWNIKLTSSGGELLGKKEDLETTGSQTALVEDVLNATFKSSTEGTYTITVKGELTFDDPNSDLGISKKNASATATITVQAPPQEEPKEEAPAEQPKEEQPAEQPKEEKPAEQPKEEKPAEQPKEEKPVEQPKEEKPVEKPAQKEPEKSSNNKLKMLGIKPNDFRNFKPTTTTYYITVPYEVSEVNVYADRAEDSQTITGTGDVELKEGKNTVRVVCTAEDGTTKTYTMYITREAEVVEEPEEEEPQQPETPVQEEPKAEETETTGEEDTTDATDSTVQDKVLGITELNIVAKTEEGKELLPELSPSFSENTYEYMLAVPLTAKDVEVTVQAQEGTPTVEVMGNKQLAEGENLVTVIVKLGEDTKVYQINVIKSEQITETVLSNEIIMQLAMIAAVATVIIVGIVATIIMIAKSKKKDKTPLIEGAKIDKEEMQKEEPEKIESKIE